METNGEPDKNLEGNLREAACFGDERAVKIFVEGGVNVNAKHEINGWTPLHWAAKRGHVSIVNYLLANGADKNIISLKGEKAEDLTDREIIREALGSESKKERDSSSDSSTLKLPIVPNYIANPVLSYKVDASNMGHLTGEKSPENISRQSTAQNCNTGEKDFVIKLRVADLPLEADFIEVEIPFPGVSFAVFLQSCCKELKIDPKKVVKVRKLPNTLVRNDKDVSRLKPFQEIELVMNYINQQVHSTQSLSRSAYSNNPSHINSWPISRPSSHSHSSHSRNAVGENLMEKSAYCRNGTLLY